MERNSLPRFATQRQLSCLFPVLQPADTFLDADIRRVKTERSFLMSSWFMFYPAQPLGQHDLLQSSPFIDTSMSTCAADGRRHRRTLSHRNHGRMAVRRRRPPLPAARRQSHCPRPSSSGKETYFWKKCNAFDGYWQSNSCKSRHRSFDHCHPGPVCIAKILPFFPTHSLQAALPEFTSLPLGT